MGDSSDADVRTFDAKNFGLFENYAAFDQTGVGWVICFRNFVRTSFMDTAPYFLFYNKMLI